MKKVLLYVTVLLFVVNNGYSQISPITERKLINQNDKLIKKIKDYSNAEIGFDIIAKLCVENWELDSLDNLVKNGEGTMTLDKLDDNRFKLTQDIIQTDDTGQMGELVSEVYFRGLPMFSDELESGIDSLTLSILQAGIKIPFIKEIYYYDSNDKPFKKISYLNYALFGLPNGFSVSDSTNYFYDNKDFLVGESTYISSFSDFTMSLSDSTVYTNNAKGLKTESIIYSVDYDDNLVPYNKYTYIYDSQDRLIKEESFDNYGEWILTSRRTTDYQTKLTIELRETTNDQGTTWEPANRDSIYFNSDLPFGFPNRESSSEYADGQWKVTNVSLYSDCSGTFTNDIEKLSFVSRFDGDDIVITTDKIINNANITLYNTNGQVVFSQKFRTLPERISTNKLIPGIYILEIKGNEIKGINKMIKF
ncbi:MAG TPA: T9SS type A sorting domain-containing protein [Bacteroidetes bacterium]|nr:T9SS type A sorting domain-containing protein [Bacteroidota bacterium]